MENNPWARRRSSTQRAVSVAGSNCGGIVRRVDHEETRSKSGEMGSSRVVKNLNEKLASVLLGDQCAIRAEDGVSSAGMENGEEEEAVHEPALLKQFMRQLSSIPEEQEPMMDHESLVDPSSPAALKELGAELRDLAINNAYLSRSLMVKEKLIGELHKQASQAAAEFTALLCRLDSTEKENAFLKYEFRMLENEIDARNEELAYSRQHADASRRQHLECVKQVAKMEAECQKLRERPRFAAAAAAAAISRSSHEVPEKSISFLLERLVATEEENRSLKEALMKKNAELQSTRVMFSRTASRLSQVEAQPGSDFSGGGVRSMEVVKYSYPVPGSEIGSDDGVSSSSGSCLLPELESFRDGKVVRSLRHDQKSIESLEMCLMDDFVEMEKLAIVSTTNDDHEEDQDFDWLQIVLKALNRQQRVSKRSIPELLEDIHIALGCSDHLNTHHADSSLSKSMCKIVELVERFETLVAAASISSFEDRDSNEESSALVVLEPSPAMQRFALACNSLVNGKTTVEKFAEELYSALECITSNHTVSNQRLKEAAARLKSAGEQTESLTSQLHESEHNIRNVMAEMETLREYKYMVEDQLENQKSINEELDTQLSVARAHLNEVMQKYSCLEVELEDKHDCCEELESTCLDLQLQLESVTSNETINNGAIEERKQSSHNEWEITAASAKLAECQETILNLGKQLKALASPREAALFDKVFNAGNAAALTTTTTTNNNNNNNNNRNLFRRFSLRDQMLAEDKSKAIVLYSPVEEEEAAASREPPEQHNGDAAAGVKAADFAAAMAVVPGKRNAGVRFLRKLLMRRKKAGSSKKSPPSRR